MRACVLYRSRARACSPVALSLPSRTPKHGCMLIGVTGYLVSGLASAPQVPHGSHHDHTATRCERHKRHQGNGPDSSSGSSGARMAEAGRTVLDVCARVT